jgi:acetaldehyde dehydrogenase (acetylating)
LGVQIVLRDQDLVSVQEVRTKVEKAWAAWQLYRGFSQAKVDAIVERMGEAGRAHAVALAEAAVEETGYGNVPDKVAKNLLNADLLPRSLRGMKTVGVLRENAETHIVEIGEPVGVIGAVLPTTNPTSTAIYKAIIALKAGNAIVMSPHPRAKNCTARTAKLMNDAAVAAGAPDGLVQCLEDPTLEATQALMRHEKTALILSTGGAGIVKAAYSSGKPAFGVGPGNVPVLVDESADIKEAAAKIVSGKSFDYGTVCSSEQTLVAVGGLRDRILVDLKANRAFLCSKEQGAAIEKILFSHGTTVSSKCVGQSPQVIAKMAGFTVPENASILCVEIEGYGKEHPLSAEKLSPVLALLFVRDFASALDACEGILRFGGLGHTCAIYAKDDARVREFGMRMPAFRVLVNTGSPQGSTGITTGVAPGMTLGCGAIAGNITSDNIGPLHLINIKRIAYSFRNLEDVLDLPDLTKKTVDRSTVTAAVEQYLADRNGCGCGCKSKCAAKVETVDFVSEADVLAAIAQAKKIHIGPKTIVTPAARDAAARGDILVLAEGK